MAGAPLLLLWDIDGTLLQRASVEHARALRRAIEEVHGVSGLELHRVDAAGRTDGAIARDLALAAGVEAGAIDALAAEVREATARAFTELCPADLSDRVAAGVHDALDALRGEHRQSLLTGNFEPVARLKLERAGIGGFFPRGQGGFDSDHEDRTELPAIARARAGRPGRPYPREETVVIGDTPLDVACAHADGVRCIGVTTGEYGAAELDGADTIVGSARELAAVL